MIRCGVIEGFFGKPWDWPARLSGIDFLRDLGFQFYIYAPKADAFLRRRWREPMPEETLRHLSELSVRGAANGVCIGVGLTPFEIYLNYDADAQTALRSKVHQINDTGTDVLCILFDDMTRQRRRIAWSPSCRGGRYLRVEQRSAIPGLPNVLFLRFAAHEGVRSAAEVLSARLWPDD
jgi:hypothetical protein